MYVSSKDERGGSPPAPIGAHLLTIDPVLLHSGHAKGIQGRRERAAINLDCWFINHHLTYNFTIFNCCSLLRSRKPWTRNGIEPVGDLRNLKLLALREQQMERDPFCKDDDVLLWVGKKRVVGFAVVVHGRPVMAPHFVRRRMPRQEPPGVSGVSPWCFDSPLKLIDFRFVDEPKCITAAVALAGLLSKEVPRSNNNPPPTI